MKNFRYRKTREQNFARQAKKQRGLEHIKRFVLTGKELTMGSQLLLSILKDSGIADIAVSIVDYFIGKKDFDKKKKSAASRQAKKGGLR